ncbi:DEAD/DEAH box helicase [bacterium]|nr:DEAD/DEAH box helicase [bacterium]
MSTQTTVTSVQWPPRSILRTTGTQTDPTDQMDVDSSVWSVEAEECEHPPAAAAALLALMPPCGADGAPEAAQPEAAPEVAQPEAAPEVAQPEAALFVASEEDDSEEDDSEEDDSEENGSEEDDDSQEQCEEDDSQEQCEEDDSEEDDSQEDFHVQPRAACRIPAGTMALPHVRPGSPPFQRWPHATLPAVSSPPPPPPPPPAASPAASPANLPATVRRVLAASPEASPAPTVVAAGVPVTVLADSTRPLARSRYVPLSHAEIEERARQRREKMAADATALAAEREAKRAAENDALRQARRARELELAHAKDAAEGKDRNDPDSATSTVRSRHARTDIQLAAKRRDRLERQEKFREVQAERAAAPASGAAASRAARSAQSAGGWVNTLPVTDSTEFQKQLLPASLIRAGTRPLPPVTDLHHIAVAAGLTPTHAQWCLANYLGDTQENGLGPRHLMMWPTGAGKTLGALLAALHGIRTGRLSGAVILGTKQTTENFVATLGKLVDAGIDRRTADLITISAHDTFITAHKDIVTDTQPKYDAALAVLKAELNNKLLVVDEVHEYRTTIVTKGCKGKGALSIVEAAACAKEVLLMTATPVCNKPGDMCNLAKILRNDASVLSPGAMELLAPPEASDSDKIGPYLRRALATRLFSGLISTVRVNLDDFPTIRIVEHPITLRRAVEVRMVNAELDEADATLMGISKSSAFHVNSRTASNAVNRGRADADSDAEADGDAEDEGDDGKLSAIRSIMQNHPGQKTIIHSAFLQNGGGLIARMLDEEGISYAVVNGKTSPREVAAAVAAFNTSDVQVIIVSNAGSVGLDFVGTRVVIVMEPTWHQPATDQIIGRARRFRSHHHLPPSERNVTVYKLVVRRNAALAMQVGASLDSGDQRVAALADKKSALTTAFLREIRPCFVTL